MNEQRHQAALKIARKRLRRDLLLYSALPVIACWMLWAALGGGLLWPIIPTLAGAAWAWAVWDRWRAISADIGRQPKAPQSATVPRRTQSAAEIPRIRFTESGDPTDSFIEQLHKDRQHDQKGNE
ncbi:MAG: hypothetical protein EA396_07860 [Anaerolineaceae bacterium]|nr:MAG: hypothetical protein EA396_07860 [Anaerolineaceae bacterium]